jgi:MFS family permease
LLELGKEFKNNPSPNFARPDEFEPLIPQAINSTGIERNDIKILFGMTYYISSSVSFLLSSLSTIFFVLLGIQKFRALNNYSKKIGIISLRYSNLFVSAIGVFIGQLLTTIGVLYVPYPANYYLILSGRIIFGFFDGFQESIRFRFIYHLVTTLGYVADEFKNKNFANAVSLFIAIWSLGNVWAPTYHQSIPIQYILWFITALCLFGIIVVVILGSVQVFRSY